MAERLVNDGVGVVINEAVIIAKSNQHGSRS